ncbi:MAG: hypothetical protein J6U37_00370 [Lachnospiraceae bacterium]|nr:hypothetical protein [Lachnospiraceae bacterium]
MIPYSLTQIIFFFYCYCFIGWIIESTYVSVRTRKLTNRGFMRGPFIPIYGFGGLVMLLAGTPLLKWPVLVFFAGMISASALEYVTGAAMEAIFKVRYWDYSNEKFNLNGHICLFTSICWGLLSVALDYFIHKPIEKLSEMLMGKPLEAIVNIISIYFIVDLTLSFKAAFDLRSVIIKMEEAKEELRLMGRRIDVILALIDDEKNQRLEKLGDTFEELNNNIEEGLNKIKSMLSERPDAIADNIREEYEEFVKRLAVKRDNNTGLQSFREFYKRGIFLGNPTLNSKRFKDSVETIKKFIEENRKNWDK